VENPLTNPQKKLKNLAANCPPSTLTTYIQKTCAAIPNESTASGKAIGLFKKTLKELKSSENLLDITILGVIPGCIGTKIFDITVTLMGLTPENPILQSATTGIATGSLAYIAGKIHFDRLHSQPKPKTHPEKTHRSPQR
jgi:hypothetical protein